MRYVFVLIGLVCFAGSNALAFSLPKSRFLDSMVVKLDRSLLSKDTVSLQTLLHEKLTYGHSNGWIETKRDVIDDLYNGKLTYQQINTTERKIEYNGKLAVVRAKADVDVLVNNTPVHVKLNILQVWRLKHKRWVLIARQSVKI